MKSSFLLIVFAATFIFNSSSFASTLESDVRSYLRSSTERFSGQMSPADCAQILAQLATAIHQIDPKALLANELAKGTPARDLGREVYDLTGNLRFGILEKLTQFSAANPLDYKAITEFRNALRSIRALGEAFLFYSASATPGSQVTRGVLVHPKYKEALGNIQDRDSHSLENFLETGDVFVVRGNSEISALIARISQGDADDGQASHVFTVFRDESGKLFALESLIEDGLRIRPFDFFNKRHARFTVYRPRDREVAKKGAKALHDAIRITNKAGLDVRYNFSMRPYDPESAPVTGGLFEAYCTQSAGLQALWGSSGRECLPTYSSKIFMDHPWLLSKLKIKNDSSVYAPSDAEIEPQFDFVFEVSNAELAHDAFLSDAILSGLLGKMNEGYEISKNWKSRLATWAVLPFRRAIEPVPSWVPGFGYLKNRLPWYIQADQFELMVLLNGLYKIIKPKLVKLEESYRAANGHSMTWIELESAVERILTEDSRVRRIFKRQERSTP